MIILEATPIWHIAGVGAIGTLLAGCFSHTGQAVCLILKNQQQLASYQTSNLTVVTAHKVITCHPHALDLAHIGNKPIDLLLCSVKAYDVLELLKQLKSNLNANSIIILIHNGLGVLDEIKTQYPQLRIIFGLSTLGAYLEKPFAVQAFLEGNIYLGELLGQFSAHEVDRVCKAFQTAQLPYQWVENIDSKMWEKFAINCSINLLTALFECKNGELDRYDDLIKKLTTEISQVLNTQGFYITADELFSTVTTIIRATANNYSSMYKDVQQEKPHELPYLNEHLVILAREKSIPTPVNDELLRRFYVKYQRYKN